MFKVSPAKKKISLNGQWQIKDFVPDEGVTSRVYTAEYATDDWVVATVLGEVPTSLRSKISL